MLFTAKEKFDPGLDIQFLKDTLDFRYGPGVFGPKPEYRSLDSIRQSLHHPNTAGPDPVYAIAMDVGRVEDREELNRRMLLFGVVMYASGKLGDGPVRSQGHVHAVSPHCGWSTPELFEIWDGHAVIYGQEKSGDDPGRCIAVRAGPGERVVMPPSWAHYVVNAERNSELIFGAWCDRQYGFDYTQMRAHHGLAWFPAVADGGEINWEANPNYSKSRLEVRDTRTYPELGLEETVPIYTLFRYEPEAIQWVSDPARFQKLWPAFEP
ncbi:MAG: glucose-6-phosphate isomerase family protein [Candidatus Acidiferrales bacterium]